ncbi:hypothetical protein Ga0100231_013800 [Opitutaceae bacterium TAV4]|nr:hypothetical protein Ga0100231_013800 [Opitutaceae bacterium TAV4]
MNDVPAIFATPDHAARRPPRIVLVGGLREAERLRWERSFLETVSAATDPRNSVALLAAAGLSLPEADRHTLGVTVWLQRRPACLCCPDARLVSDIQNLVNTEGGGGGGGGRRR